MAFKKYPQKKYNGVSRYLNKDGETTALYLTYRDIDQKVRKVKADSLLPDDARAQLDTIKAQIVKQKKALGSDKKKLERAASTKRIIVDSAYIIYYNERRTVQRDKDYRNFKNRISPAIGNMQLSKVNKKDLLLLQDDLKTKYAPKTINDTMDSLKAFFNVAIKKGWLSSNPVTEVAKVKVDKENGRVLTDEERDRMFTLLKEYPTLELFIKLLYYSGARPTAILNLQVKDIADGKIRIQAMKKGDSYTRRIKKEIYQDVENWIKENDLKFEDYLFYSKQEFKRSGNNPAYKLTPMSMSSFSKPAKKFFDKHFNQGIPTSATMHRITLYSLRRTAGTNVYKGTGLVQAMKFLHHSDIKTTMIYLNVSDDQEEVQYAL